MKRLLTPRCLLSLVLAAVLVGLGIFLSDALSVISREERFLITRHEQGIGMLTEQPITQSLTVPEEGLVDLRVMVSNYGKKVRTGEMKLRLLDDAGRVLAESVYPADTLKNNAFVTMDQLPAIAKGQRVTLEATSTITDHKGVTLRAGEIALQDAAPVLTLADGTVQDGLALNLSLGVETRKAAWMPAMLCFLMALCLLVALPMTMKKENA